MPKVCSQCGTAIGDEVKLCPRCGWYDTSEPERGVPQTATPAKTIEEGSSAPSSGDKHISLGTWIIAVACVFILGALVVGLSMRVPSAPTTHELAKVSEKPPEVPPVTPEVTIHKATPEVTVPTTSPAAPVVEEKAVPEQKAPEVEKDAFGRPFLYGTPPVNRGYYPGGATAVFPGSSSGSQSTMASPASTQVAQPQPAQGVEKDAFGRPFLYGTPPVNRGYYPGGTTVVFPGPEAKGG